MTADAHHAHARRRRLWRQVCDSLWTSAVHTSRYVARHKPASRLQAGHRWDWELKAICGIEAVVGSMAIACLVGFIKVRSGT